MDEFESNKKSRQHRGSHSSEESAPSAASHGSSPVNTTSHPHFQAPAPHVGVGSHAKEKVWGEESLNRRHTTKARRRSLEEAEGEHSREKLTKKFVGRLRALTVKDRDGKGESGA